MTLDDYLNLDGAPTAADFATRCGLSAVSISRIRRGEQNITRDVMRAIIAASGGLVTADGLIAHGAPSTDSAEAPSPGNGAGVSGPCSGAALEAAE